MYQPGRWIGERVDRTAVNEAIDAPSPALLWIVPVSLLLWAGIAVGVAAALRG